MTVERTDRLLLNPHRQAGLFARRLAEQARSAWFESAEGDRERLWSEYRRSEMGARAEEEAGRFLQLLDGWEGAKVFHAVEFLGAGLPRGDVDHVVLFEHLGFAFVVESKYRLGEAVEETHLPRVLHCAEVVSEVLGLVTWPVLCQALPTLRDDIHGESIERRWSHEGNALLCDAEYLPRSIQDIVGDLEAFRAGNWFFPDQRPSPQPAPIIAPPPELETVTPAPSATTAHAQPAAVEHGGSFARKLTLAFWWLPSFFVVPFGSWLIAGLLTHSKRYFALAVLYAALFIAIGVANVQDLVYAYWALGLLHVTQQSRTVKVRSGARAQRTALTASS
jgi:hypothetical protein